MNKSQFKKLFNADVVKDLQHKLSDAGIVQALTLKTDIEGLMTRLGYTNASIFDNNAVNNWTDNIFTFGVQDVFCVAENPADLIWESFKLDLRSGALTFGELVSFYEGIADDIKEFVPRAIKERNSLIKAIHKRG